MYYKNEQYNENQQEFNISLTFNKLKTNCLTNTSDNCFKEITQIRAYLLQVHNETDAQLIISKYNKNTIKKKKSFIQKQKDNML